MALHHSAVLLMNLIIDKFICASIVGVTSRIMGTGPAYTILAVLKQRYYEINEAFIYIVLRNCALTFK
ncbi:16167_t:CDS:1, partial [Entrophospora sp. SA101]